VPLIFTRARARQQSALSTTYAYDTVAYPLWLYVTSRRSKAGFTYYTPHTHVYVQNSLQPCTVPKYVQQQLILVWGGGIAVFPIFAHRKMKSLSLLIGAFALRREKCILRSSCPSVRCTQATFPGRISFKNETRDCENPLEKILR